MRCVLLFVFVLCSAAGASGDPSLFFREDWTETPPAIPVTTEHLANQQLELSLHGPGRSVIKKSFHVFKVDDPHYIWSGLCHGTWALSLRKQGAMVDLSQGRVRWRSKQAGFRQLRVIIKTADGKWLVSDASDGPSEDWRVREFVMANIRWRELDIETVVEGAWADDADLTRVVEVGFTDLMAGGRSRACSRLDWIEVYGQPVE